MTAGSEKFTSTRGVVIERTSCGVETDSCHGVERQRVRGGGAPGGAAEDHAVRDPVAAAYVARPVDAAGALACGEQPRHRRGARVEDVGVRVDLQAAGGDPERRRSNLDAVERRLLERAQELRRLAEVAVLAERDRLVVARDRAGR